VREGYGGSDQMVTGTERGVQQQNMPQDQGNSRRSEVRIIPGVAETLRDTVRITEGLVRDLGGDTKIVTETERETVKN